MSRISSSSCTDLVNNYFDGLIKSRFIELIGDPVTNSKGWPKKKMRDLLIIERGGSPRPIDAFITDDEHGLNWIKIGDAIEGSYYINSVKEKIKPEGLKKTRQVYPGDLILSNSMSFGKPYILNISGCIHDGWLVLHDSKDQFNKVFLCFTLGFPSITEAFKMMARGGVVNNLNKDLVGDLDMIVPPKDVQEEFVQFLEQVDKSRNIFEKEVEKFDQLIKSRFIEEFGDLKINSKNWTLKRLADVAAVPLHYGSTAFAIEYDSSVRYVRITDIDTNGKLNEDFKSPSEYDEKYLLNKGDILFARSGSVGLTYEYNEDYKSIFAGYLIRFIPDKSKLNPTFVYYFTRSDYCQSILIGSKRGGVQKNVNAKQLGDIVIPLPPIELQESFVEFVKQVDKSRSIMMDDLLNDLKSFVNKPN